MKLIGIVFVILLCGCDYFNPERVKERVEADIETASSEMTINYAEAKDTFNLTYRRALQATSDTLVIKNLQKFYSIFIETIDYMDSLKIEMQKLDKSDRNNTKLVKQIFITDGIGDTLFNKLQLSYTIAETIALTSEKKSAIIRSRANALDEPNTEKRIEQYFGMNMPLGTAMIIYGFETELLKIGLESLDGYYQNK